MNVIEKIEALEAGEKIDNLIAEGMGWTWGPDGLGNEEWSDGLRSTGYGEGGVAGRPYKRWAPSTDLNAAIVAEQFVVEQLHCDRFWVEDKRGGPERRYSAIFMVTDEYPVGKDAGTAALAICRAVLTVMIMEGSAAVQDMLWRVLDEED